MTEPYFNLTYLNNVTNATLFFENATTNSIDDLEHFVSISVFILFSFIFLAGLVGNGLVVMGKAVAQAIKVSFPEDCLRDVFLFRSVVAANPLMRSTTNILIINLAVADLLFVIFCKVNRKTPTTITLMLYSPRYRRSLHRYRLHT